LTRDGVHDRPGTHQESRRSRRREKHSHAARRVAEGKVKTLDTDKTALTQRAETAEGKVTALETEKTTLTQRAEKAEGQVKTLEAAKQTTTQAATEQAAAMGVTAVQKPNEAVQQQQTDPAELWVKYSKASSTEQAVMRAEHGDKLDAAAAAFDKRAKS